MDLMRYLLCYCAQATPLQSQAEQLSQLTQFLPSQTPNHKLPTPDNNAALGTPNLNVWIPVPAHRLMGMLF